MPGAFVEIHGREAGVDLASKRIFTRGRPFLCTATPAAGAANITIVTFQVVDYFGAPVAGVFNMDVHLSDAATGAGVTATTASGAVAAGNAGIDLVAMIAKKALRVQTDASGIYRLSITDTAKTAFKVCYQIADSGVKLGATLTTANYG